jgi:glucosamine--fructose-6-phosphate aminotransferase (isomerizing)
MCGIIGIIGKQAVTQRLIEGLQRLEYRGYDSAGLAVLTPQGIIERRRAAGKIQHLTTVLQQHPIEGNLGIAHTRWATHGVANENNAHPHATKEVAVVHNGIIENHAELRTELKKLGHEFSSDTDTESIVHLLTHYVQQGMEPLPAVQAAMKRLHGAFALAIIFRDAPHQLIGVRRGAPLAIGYGDDEMYLGSDALAVAPLSKRISYLEDDDIAVLSNNGITIYDSHGDVIERPIQESRFSSAMIGKGDYRHFMLKEIFEQPSVLGDTLHAFTDHKNNEVNSDIFEKALRNLTSLTIVACGTSYYAAMVAKYWFESYAHIPVMIDVASEFRYRRPPLQKGGVALFISQSGETADTLAAAHYAKEQGQIICAIVNVPESSLLRLADVPLLTHAGPEIGVASTKAFTNQLMVLACFALAAARKNNMIGERSYKHLFHTLLEVPEQINALLHQDDQIHRVSTKIAESRDVLFLGRGLTYGIALEGALKLKELSYIHAEGYAAGEMKHGPIALVDDQVPIIALAPTGPLFDKILSNIEEVHVRGGKIIFISDANGLIYFKDKAFASLEIPVVDAFVTPFLYTIPLQLLAYHTALLRGTDIDQPRNLAKF